MILELLATMTTLMIVILALHEAVTATIHLMTEVVGLRAAVVMIHLTIEILAEVPADALPDPKAVVVMIHLMIEVLLEILLDPKAVAAMIHLMIEVLVEVPADV